MDKQTITPDTAPAGSRILAKESSFTRNVFEVEVVEWSPSGDYVKVRHLSGSINWSKDLPAEGVLIEALPSLPM